MKAPTLARLGLIIAVTAAFAAAGWHLMTTAPQGKRERPAAPVPLVDVVESRPYSHSLTLDAAGPVISAQELEIRPQVGGRIVALHRDFEPGGRIPAGETVLRIEPDDYRLAVTAAEAEIAKARAAIALEQGRRIVAREELASLGDSLRVDAASQALALRDPQLKVVQAELAAAENRLAQASLDLARTELRLPFDVVVLERTRVADEVVAARELIGRVTRADRYWVELRVDPAMLPRLRARAGDTPGSRVVVHEAGAQIEGEVVRLRADLAEGSRLAGVIAAVPAGGDGARLLLGSYVEAQIDAGAMPEAVAVPRRAVRDNDRVWVVDETGRLQVRDAEVVWSSRQRVLLAAGSLHTGDRVVVSRVSGLVPGSTVRSRPVTADSDRPQVVHAESGNRD